MGVAVSSAYTTRADLNARVKALANPEDPPPVSAFNIPLWMVALSLLCLNAFGLLASAQVHEATEAMGRFLAL